MAVTGLVVLSAAIGAVVLGPARGEADQGGVYVQFGLPGVQGAERDRNGYSMITVNAGTPIVFWNRSGWGHQVAVYDKDLAKNGTTAGTTLADITIPAGGTRIDDAVGRLALGPDPASVGCNGPDFCAPLTQGGTDFTYTFSTPGTYLVICNIRPHLVNYAQATFVVVK
jgi:plastocyanin